MHAENDYPVLQPELPAWVSLNFDAQLVCQLLQPQAIMCTAWAYQLIAQS